LEIGEKALGSLFAEAWNQVGSFKLAVPIGIEFEDFLLLRGA
jgi:hypothetical protein